MSEQGANPTFFNMVDQAIEQIKRNQERDYQLWFLTRAFSLMLEQSGGHLEFDIKSMEEVDKLVDITMVDGKAHITFMESEGIN